ncbi:polyribonucleotide nucleotidyltransferase, partial [bacterium]|nr:polyribonucleotide nucleotidyltransferase [bacterium]
LFTRGETQSLAVTTLGTAEDEQQVESLAGESSKKFMLHYAFPPYSVGETRPVRAPGRREIGHGNLAERSLRPVLPAEFMYTIRVTSDITESNGSSSMASVCGGTLSLMDAGVPISAPVAGISCGLIEEGDTRLLLTDIIGDEDHFGDMDFKVAGTAKGVTGVQVDLKIDGLPPAFIAQILERTRNARMKILETMARTLAAPRPEISPYAPKIITIHIPVDKIGALIGPGGKTVRKLQEETKTTISIEDDGTVQIAADNEEAAEAGRKRIEFMMAEAEIGKIYEGPVTRILNFGAFIRILPDVEGMVHVSEIADERIPSVEDRLKIGDIVKARVIEVDEKGRVNLTMRGLDAEFDPSTVRKRGDRPDRGHGDRGHGDRPRRDHGDRPRGDRPPRR